MKRIVLLILTGLLLTGCAKNPTSQRRVVTGIHVEYQTPENHLSRTYTTQENMQSVLNYLRMLEPYGEASVQTDCQFTCRFVLQYSHGPDAVYFQEGYDRLCQEGSGWKRIHSSQAQLLYPLLLLLPSDE